MADLVMEFLPVIIVVAIIGAFTIAFLIAYAALRKYKDESDDMDRKMSDREIIVRLLRFQALPEKLHRCFLHHALFHHL